jgi:plasmid stabilization system protein ParE
MTYRVVWDPPAERDLTAIWLSSRMRHAVRESADRIDASLARNPHDCGESRDAGMRMMFEGRLGILFTVHDERREVRVLSVWTI